jgi:hypothetical protein
MKFRFFAVLLAFTSIFAFTVTGQEDAYTRNIPVNDFSRIYIEGGYRVFLYQTSDPYLKVKAPTDNHIDALEIESSLENLKLSVARRQFNLSHMELHIGFSNLEELHISGGVKLSTDGYVALEYLRVYTEGAVSGDMKLKAGTVEVISNGASFFELSGVADLLTVRVAGAAHVNSRELTAKAVQFRVEGLGFGSVHAAEELDVRIEGVGKVTYTGKPNVKRFVEGLGSVSEY